MKCKLGMIFFTCTALATAATDPFGVFASLQSHADGKTQLVVRVAIPDGHLVYADEFIVEALEGAMLTPVSFPKAIKKVDAFSDRERSVFDKSFSATYEIVNSYGSQLSVKVVYQGCDKLTCFLPVEQIFKFSLSEPFTTTWSFFLRFMLIQQPNLHVTEPVMS